MPHQEPFSDSPPDENPSGLGVFEYPLRESNYYADKETGMRYAMTRDCYDPATGRFCQSDPSGLDDGENTYAYVGLDPLGWIDPDGARRIGGPSKGGAKKPTTPGQKGKEKCWLYQIVDCKFETVYVGITNNPEVRNAQHEGQGIIKRYQCPGCPLQLILVQEYSSRRVCKGVESTSIFLFRPIFNDAENPDSPAERQRKRQQWRIRNCGTACGPDDAPPFS